MVEWINIRFMDILKNLGKTYHVCVLKLKREYVEDFMNNNGDVYNRNIIKTIIFCITIILFALITFTILAVLLDFFSDTSLKIILIAALIIEGLAFITLLFFLFKLFKSIDVVNRQAEQIAQGDLNIGDISRQEGLGLGILTEAFNDMKSNLLRFIVLTKANIISISDAIEKVSKSMNSSYVGNEEIAASMENVAKRAKDQANLMGNTMSNINEVKTRIENIAQSVEQVEKSIKESVQATASGVKNLDEYYNQVNIISDNLNNTSEYIKKLNEDIEKIDEIGRFIRKTSDQLKLLGRNASVEAAKAGEAGRGFAIVAHEMNSLSTVTKENIGKIGGILKSIQTRSEYVNDGIDNCVESYDISKDIFKSIKHSFDIINNSANVLEADIRKVNNEVQLINSNILNTTKESEQLYKISEDISSKTIDVSAVTQTELDGLQKINESTLDLKIMLTNVERLAGRFNVSVLPVKKESTKQLRIAFITPLDNEFWHVIRKGVLYAKRELSEKNVIIDYYGFEEDVGDQIKKTVKDAIEDGVDGIIVPGFDPELANLIEVADKKNIPIVLITEDLPMKTKRVAYFGANTNSTGAIAVGIMAKALGGKGEVAVLTGEGENFGRHTIFPTLKKYKHIKVVAQAQCVDDIEISYNVTKDILTQNGNIRAILTPGMGFFGAVRAIEELGFIGKTFLISFFYSNEIADYIKKGIVYAAISHDPFDQGYDSTVHLYNMLVTGKKIENEINWLRVDIIDERGIYELL